VRESLIDLIGTLEGRVAVTAFASNVARLESVGHAARKHGRKLALAGRSMDRIVEAARATGYLSDFPAMIDLKQAAALPPRGVLYLCTGSQGEPRAALARIAAGEHSDVALGAGDTVIFSSRIIPGNDLAIFELQNKLAALGVEVITERDHFVHVSGHPAREELAQMYRWVRPRIAVPVHGELRHMTEHARLARSLQVPQAVVLQNGHMLRLAPGRAEIVDETPAGRLHLDGKVLVAESKGHARARGALGYAGFAAVTIPLDSKGRVAGDAALILEGIPDEVHQTIHTALDEVLARHDAKRGDEEALKEKTRGAIRRAAYARWGKKPVTRVEVIWV
jgi:ribonuclease J